MGEKRIMDDIRLVVADKQELGVFAEFLEEDAGERFTDSTVAVGALLPKENSLIPAGIIIGDFVDDIIELKWLYVDKSLRRRGIGQDLLCFYMDMAARISDCRGVMAVLPENKPDLIDFFDAMSFVLFEAAGRRQYAARLSEMKMPPAKSGSFNECIHRLPDISQDYLRSFEKNIMNSQQDLSLGVPFPILPKDFSDESLVYLNGRTIDAILLLKNTRVQLDDGKRADGFDIAWLYGCSKNVVALAAVLGAAKTNLRKRYGEDVPITFTTLNDSSVDLGEKLFPGHRFSTFEVAYFPFEDE